LRCAAITTTSRGEVVAEPSLIAGRGDINRPMASMAIAVRRSTKVCDNIYQKWLVERTMMALAMASTLHDHRL